MFWDAAYETIEFDIKYSYNYCFDRYSDTCIYSISKACSMIGIEIMPHLFPSVYMVL